MFAARVPHARGAWGSAGPPPRFPFFVRVGALVRSVLSVGTDPDALSLDRNRAAMAALGRASVVVSPSVHPAVADSGSAWPHPLRNKETAMTEKTAADVLEDAADWLLVNGRCRSSLTDGEGRGCVMWAMYGGPDLTNVRAPVSEAEQALQDHLVAAGHSPWYITWNEDTEDDFEVIDTLRHVAKQLRNGETS